jgi:hypothetical protein
MALRHPRHQPRVRWLPWLAATACLAIGLVLTVTDSPHPGSGHPARRVEHAALRRLHG